LGEACGSPAKHPRTERGLEDATTDRDQIAEWWSRWPEANIGLRTGQGSNLAVLDVDDVQAFLKMTEEHGKLPTTLLARTGRVGGGVHLYFEHREGVTNRKGSLPKGVEVRGEGGYVLAPPSLHISGNRYAWDDVDAPIRPWPEILSKLIAQRPERRPLAAPNVVGGNTPYGAKALDNEMLRLKTAQDGERNTTLNEVGFCLFQLVAGGELEEQTVTSELVFMARGLGLSDHEIEGTLRSAREGGFREPRSAPEKTRSISAHAHNPGAVLPEGSDADPSNGRSLLAGIRSGTWLDSQDFPDLNYHVPLLVPEGMTLLVGPPKIGKSWWVLDVALALAAGGVALGTVPVEKRPVLYLALEDGDRRMQSRCRTLLAQETIPAGFEYMVRVEPGKTFETIEAWLNLHKGESPLVILDTLGKVMPPSAMGESSYQRDYRVGGQLKNLADSNTGSAILINHHDRKANAEDFVDAVSGTHGLAGSADTTLVVSRNRTEAEAVLKVTGRDVKEAEYALLFNDGIWTADGTDLEDAAKALRERRQSANLGERSADVLAFVNDHPEGVTPAQVSLAFLDMNNNAASTYLGRLLDAGRITKPKRGVYTPVVSVGSVGKDAESTSDTTLTTLTTPPYVKDSSSSVETTDRVCEVCGQRLIGDPAATRHPTCLAVAR
jgi:hypothetical protein